MSRLISQSYWPAVLDLGTISSDFRGLDEDIIHLLDLQRLFLSVEHKSYFILFTNRKLNRENG